MSGAFHEFTSFYIFPLYNASVWRWGNCSSCYC